MRAAYHPDHTIVATIQQMSAELGRVPTPAEYQARVGCTREQANAALAITKSVLWQSNTIIGFKVTRDMVVAYVNEQLNHRHVPVPVIAAELGIYPADVYTIIKKLRVRPPKRVPKAKVCPDCGVPVTIAGHRCRECANLCRSGYAVSRYATRSSGRDGRHH